jgi:NAD(P)-dependent dehydrogenase (short-subunit alcohol dehydrogenase family)
LGGKVAVVTGAGSGIGRALALELAHRGARLALCDVDDAALAQTAALVELGSPGASVHSHHLDVSDREAFALYVQIVLGHYGVVHQLYNNAGIAGIGTIADAPWEIFDRVIATNLWGVIHGTRFLLPHLIASGDGHVINVSSLYGLMAQSENGPYCTAKFAVRGFTESLRLELARERAPVKVTLVHPGGVKTNIAMATLALSAQVGREPTDEDRRAVALFTDKLLRMDPGKAAKIILAGVETGAPRVLVGNDAKLGDLAVRLFPSGYARAVIALERLMTRASR